MVIGKEAITSWRMNNDASESCRRNFILRCDNFARFCYETARKSVTFYHSVYYGIKLVTKVMELEVHKRVIPVYVKCQKKLIYSTNSYFLSETRRR